MDVKIGRQTVRILGTEHSVVGPRFTVGYFADLRAYEPNAKPIVFAAIGADVPELR